MPAGPCAFGFRHRPPQEGCLRFSAGIAFAGSPCSLGTIHSSHARHLRHCGSIEDRQGRASGRARRDQSGRGIASWSMARGYSRRSRHGQPSIHGTPIATMRAIVDGAPSRANVSRVLGADVQEERQPLPAAPAIEVRGMIRNAWLADGFDQQASFLQREEIRLEGSVPAMESH